MATMDSNKDQNVKDLEDKETLLNQLKEEFNLIQQKRQLLKDHEQLIKE